MSHEAYRKAQETTAHPRDAEYRAFSEATRLLMAAKEEGRADLKQLIEAIHLNRTLWGALAADCADSANQLPSETRALIISLARWVSVYSSNVMQKKESVEPLIDVNRIIMDGLAGKRPAA
jgi:flagellar protein FlaF